MSAVSTAVRSCTNIASDRTDGVNTPTEKNFNMELILNGDFGFYCQHMMKNHSPSGKNNTSPTLPLEWEYSINQFRVSSNVCHPASPKEISKSKKYGRIIKVTTPNEESVFIAGYASTAKLEKKTFLGVIKAHQSRIHQLNVRASLKIDGHPRHMYVISHGTSKFAIVVNHSGLVLCLIHHSSVSSTSFEITEQKLDKTKEPKNVRFPEQKQTINDYDLLFSINDDQLIDTEVNAMYAIFDIAISRDVQMVSYESTFEKSQERNLEQRLTNRTNASTSRLFSAADRCLYWNQLVVFAMFLSDNIQMSDKEMNLLCAQHSDVSMASVLYSASLPVFLSEFTMKDLFTTNERVKRFPGQLFNEEHNRAKVTLFLKKCYDKMTLQMLNSPPNFTASSFSMEGMILRLEDEFGIALCELKTKVHGYDRVKPIAM